MKYVDYNNIKMNFNVTQISIADIPVPEFNLDLFKSLKHLCLMNTNTRYIKYLQDSVVERI